jgi:hypothetical protein
LGGMKEISNEERCRKGKEKGYVMRSLICSTLDEESTVVAVYVMEVCRTKRLASVAAGKEADKSN